MADPTDLTDAIAANAASPQSVTVDGVTVQGQTLADQIAADQYLAAKAAAKRPGRGLRFSKILLGGQISGAPGCTGGFDRPC